MPQQPGAVLAQELKQSQKLSLQQTRSLDILQLPLLDIRQRITQELEHNPVLEVLEDNAELSLDEIVQVENETDDYFDDVSDAGYAGLLTGDTSSFIEGAPAHPETLRDSLLWQMRLSVFENDVRTAGEALIQNLDNDGFNIIPL
ncbi:MAG: RNA polymerase sigma-54 factor, partial [Spirochaetaceae bacterium]|nr:RNA polymerase sigma-54 factor [Spirochaetaceae bacterium]